MTISQQQQPPPADDREIPTPDFYRYRWAALESATVDGHFVVLSWPDGLTLRAFDLWLFENVVGRSIDAATRESVFDPADLDPDQMGSPTMAGTATVTEDGALHIDWAIDGGPDRGPDSGPDRRIGRGPTIYHPGWLRHVAEGRHRPDGWLPRPAVWRAADLAEPPTHDGSAVLDDQTVMDRWVDDLLRYGIARLRGGSLDPDLVLNIVSRMGAIRDTNFGPTWDVRAKLDPDSTANTNYRLCPHTDLPTRETPPGYQFLHCIANTVSGGFSTMADGLAVAGHLEQHHPDHYEALTTLNWIFFNRGPTVDHRWSGPIIDLGVPGSPLTLRAFHPVRGFPDMADEDVPRAYAA
ncbi:MAG: TauD/TfdA family dioxygenase, partial [Acidimicrobiales bacterium]